MKTYTFVIGTKDDFKTFRDLVDWTDSEAKHEGSIQRNAQCWEFDCPEDCSEEIVTMMGRGYAFSSDWCMDDTFSFLMEGSVSDAAEMAAIQSGIDARESMKTAARG